MAKAIFQNPMNLFWWLATPLFWWVKMRLYPSDPVRELKLTKEHPVLYVLPNRSLTDLLVLHHYCQKLGLPLPRNRVSTLRSGGSASYLYLQKLGFFQPRRSKKAPPPLLDLIRFAEKNPGLEVQLVPVSILWGRDPGRKERSLLKLLFADDANAGYFQKLLIILAQGRNSDIQFGQPISIREQTDEGVDAEQTARKIRRVLRVHFRKQRTATLGPVLYDRAFVTRQIVRSRPVQDAIDHELRANGGDRAKIEARARQMVREISAEPNHSMIRFFDVILGYLWNKIFSGVDVKNVDRVRRISETHEIVYLSSHRSHIDYLLLGYVLYYAGLVSPHTAAGVNLNFWPAGFFIRRVNGFFLRRSFKGNRLYTTVFNEYIHFLLTEGYPMNFFPEGGRSRNGRLLPPKTGMISMVVHSLLRNPRRPIAIVPVYVGYDTVMEVKSYLKELQGAKKKSESFRQLLRARRAFKRKYGRAYLSFGEPVDLKEFIAERQGEWLDTPKNYDSKPEWFPQAVEELAKKAMIRINDAAIVSPVSLVSLALLSSTQRAMTEDDLAHYLEILLSLLRQEGIGRHEPTTGTESVASIISEAETYSLVQRFKYPGGDVLFLNEHDGIIMSYYKNNILHLFALPSLVASYFVHNDVIKHEDLITNCLSLYPFLKMEFFLRANHEAVKQQIEMTIATLVSRGVLRREGDTLHRPDMSSIDFLVLRSLGYSLGTVFERYGISIAILDNYGLDQPFDRDDFESQCQLMAQRISILTGATNPEYHDRAVFKNFVEMLKRFGYVHYDRDRDVWLVVGEKVSELARCADTLLSPDIRQSMRRGRDLQGDKS